MPPRRASQRAEAAAAARALASQQQEQDQELEDSQGGPSPSHASQRAASGGSQSQGPPLPVPGAKVRERAQQLSAQSLLALKQNLELVQEQLKEAAITCADVLDAEKVQGMRDSTIAVLQLRHELEAHLSAMRDATTGVDQGGTYAPTTAQSTDFKAELARRTAERIALHPFNPRGCAALQQFDADTDGLARPAGEGDEDIVVEGNSALNLMNTRCPLTGRDVLELQKPVEDQCGYVYEDEAVRASIANHRQRGTPFVCPVVGTVHIITPATLRPSERVKRVKRRQALQGATQGTQGGSAQEAFDVEEDLEDDV